MSELVLNGLVKRRAQLAGDIENTHEALRKMVLDLESLDATIVQFDPDFQVETIQPKAFRPPKDWSNRGQMSRIILSILRQASEPMTSRDIALELLVERALDKNDQRLLRLMTKRVRPSGIIELRLLFFHALFQRLEVLSAQGRHQKEGA